MAEVKVIGKVSATDHNPSSIDDFYFWTNAGELLSPFDIVQVNHLGDSITYGRIDSISHVTDSSSHLSSFISSDFGSTSETLNGNTDRLSFNYVHVIVIGNNKNIYTPVMHGSAVKTCDIEGIKYALGLDNVKNPLTCGYLEMYGNKVPVSFNTNFIVGPDGAHLNISGISGLACKTSYCMFLLNALQQKCMYKSECDDETKSTAFVIFNLKGQDLLSIDEYGDLSSNDKNIYEQTLGIKAEPFKNVHYYYPYSIDVSNNRMQTFASKEYTDLQLMKDAADRFKYTYEACKDKLEYIFANEDESDATGTMASIIAYIESEKLPFVNIKTWKSFKEALQQVINNKQILQATNIQLSSWKKFNRIIEKVLSDKVFADNTSDAAHEVVLSESLRNIKPNEVKVVDIAKLDEKSQAFVFGDVMETLHEMMSSKSIKDMPDKIIVFVDELNKYASNDVPKNSPILRQLLEITERGRSLGLILFSVEQFRSAIHKRVKGNCATSAYGRTNFVEAAESDYRFFGDTYRNIMTRLTPGEYIVTNPALRSMLKIKFPRPTYKENK